MRKSSRCSFDSTYSASVRAEQARPNRCHCRRTPESSRSRSDSPRRSRRSESRPTRRKVLEVRIDVRCHLRHTPIV